MDGCEVQLWFRKWVECFRDNESDGLGMVWEMWFGQDGRWVYGDVGDDEVGSWAGILGQDEWCGIGVLRVAHNPRYARVGMVLVLG